MEEYTINDNTLAIISKGKSSLVYEGDEVFTINSTPNSIIKKNCLINGCTFLGRRRSAEFVTGNSYKLPIIINEAKGTIFFPTSSLRNKEISWINLNNIDFTYYDKAKEASVIVFFNKVIVKLNVSLYVIKNQIMKSTHLEHVLKNNYDRNI